MDLVNALLLAAQLLIGGTNAPAAPAGVTVGTGSTSVIVTDMLEVH